MQRREGGGACRRGLLLLAAVTLGCAPTLAGLRNRPGTADAPEVPWLPPPGFEPPPPSPPGTVSLPPNLTIEQLKKGAEVTVTDVVGIALRNNPATRSAWERARAAAAQLGRELSAYLPVIDFSASALTERQAALGGQFTFDQSVFNPTLHLSQRVLDFGARSARVEEAERALLGADFLHDTAIQDVVLLAEQAFVDYRATAALVTVNEVTVDAAKASLDAAQARETAGVATRADVLQARTAWSQAILNLETVRGQLGVVRGALATAMGLPANLDVPVTLAEPKVPVREVTEEADAYIEQAVRARPDLAASRERAAQARARITEVRTQYWPTVGIDARVDRTFFLSRAGTPQATNYSASVNLSVPIFSGFSVGYDVARAEAEAADAAAQAEQFQQQVVLDVWTSYYELKTSARRISTIHDLLMSATESFEVNSGRYEAGVGSILDLLSSQTALANARGSEVQAQASWYLALARLARAIGVLGVPDPTKPLPFTTGPAAAPRGTR